MCHTKDKGANDLASIKEKYTQSSKYDPKNGHPSNLNPSLDLTIAEGSGTAKTIIQTVQD